MITEELVKAVPVAMAMLGIVVIFLRYLTKRDETLKDISDRCHEVSDRSTDALLENAVQMGKNAVAHDKCGAALDRVNVTLVRMNGK